MDIITVIIEALAESPVYYSRVNPVRTGLIFVAILVLAYIVALLVWRT